MRCLTAATALFVFLAIASQTAFAGDFGPRGDVGTVRADAQRLLAHRARLAKVDPKSIVVSDVVVAGDQAVLSWDIGKQHGFMGLVRENNRWWDALDEWLRPNDNCWMGGPTYPLSVQRRYIDSRPPHPSELVRMGFTQQLADLAVSHNHDVATSNSKPFKPSDADRCIRDTYVPHSDVAILAAGGVLAAVSRNTGAYGISVTYSRNDAPANSTFDLLYARPPTPAEFLPYPTPYRYVSDAVMFFDITIDAPKPVSFQKGTTFDVWFPFVLDDTLRYRITFGGGQEPVGPIAGTIFDNVLHFELPAFTALPGKELMGEIDGDPH
jgi:hypothetical protein